MTKKIGIKKNQLNMLIAKAHQVTTQIIGMQLAVGNLLAICVSAISIIAGTVTFAILKFPSFAGIAMWIVSGVIGAGLALLIESMTLGALIRIRLANKGIREIEIRLEKERDEAQARIVEPDPGQADYKIAYKRYKGAIKRYDVAFRHRRKIATRSSRKSRRFSIPLAFIGAFASAVAGGLFYHTVFGGLGELESFGVAALFPVVVSCTYISSELFRDVQEAAIKEGFGGGALTETAMKEVARQQVSHQLYGVLSTSLSSESLLAEIGEQCENIMRDAVQSLRMSLQEPLELPEEADKAVVEERIARTKKAAKKERITTPLQPSLNIPSNAVSEEYDTAEREAINPALMGQSDDDNSGSNEGDTGDDKKIFEDINAALDLLSNRYPRISAWRSIRGKSVSLKSVSEITGVHHRTLSALVRSQVLTRINRYPNMVLLESVIKWLLNTSNETPKKSDKTDDKASFEESQDEALEMPSDLAMAGA